MVDGVRKYLLITLATYFMLGNAIDLKYYGFEEVVLEDGRHSRTIEHNPLIGEEVREGHIVSRREIFGRDDREEVDRDNIDEEDRIPELATVS